MDRNIVEFIARKNLNYNLDRKFGIESVSNISEIGIGSKNTQPIQELLMEKLSMPPYRPVSSDFAAIGDEMELFICVDLNQRKWFPTMDTVFPSPFRITIEHNNETINLEYNNEKLFS
jgi:hypothetical protein